MLTINGIDPKMIAQNIDVDFATHPGELIKDELEERGVSQRQLAANMGVPYTALNEIVNGKRRVNTEYALLLEAALGIPAHFFTGLQAQYDLFVARHDKSFMAKLGQVRKIAAAL